ncbi:MAG: copper homeostasis membrane protein CopD [Sphingobium sp.]
MLATLLRFGTYADLSLVAGMPLFLWLSLGAARGQVVFARLRIPFALLLIIGALLALVGLLAATAAMADTPLLPVDWEMVELILSATASGKAMLIRAALLLLILPFALKASLRPTASIAMAAAVTLAWSGHAAASEGVVGWFHLLSDIVHIAAAALWIGGMACLLVALRRARGNAALPMLRAFASIGSLIVSALVATGLYNGLMILGPDALSSMPGTTYGRLLVAKLVIFSAMLLLAANNRFRLTPAYERNDAAARSLLVRAIRVEIGLAFIILFLVGWLGMIDPSAAA